MKIIKDIFKVIISNVTTIISGIIIGFLVPKILSVEGYGLYKTFTLYVSYLGLFTFGIVDGIVLRYGANNYEDLNRLQFRSYFNWCLIIQGIITVSSLVIGFFWGGDIGFIIALLGLNLFATNFTGYYQQISQITQRFNEYSIRKILQSASSIMLVVGLYLFFINGYEVSYKVYGIGVVVINYLLLIWYLKTYREISFGRNNGLNNTFADVKKLMRNGFPLMFANLSSTLLLSLDRQFVNVLFSTQEYAIYALAYSMMSLVTVATSAISTVFYPFLKRMDEEKFKKSYDVFLVMITILVFGIVAAYYPLCIMVDIILPKYYASLPIFYIIIPGVAVSSAIHVIMHNYYKTLGKNGTYFFKSIVVLIVSGIANLIAYYFFGTMESISVASVITIVIWYVYADRGLKPECNSKTVKNVFYIVSMFTLFYVISYFTSPIVGFILYLFSYGIISLAFYKKSILLCKTILTK